MLDLVRHGSAIGRLEIGQGLGERAAGHRDAQDLRRDGRHDLGREPEGRRVERRIADRLGAEGIQMGRQMAVHAERLHQRHGRGHVI